MIYCVYGFAKQKLKHAGYKFRKDKDDYVYCVENLGRFHCKIVGNVKVDIHLDIDIDNKHSVFYTPIACKNEIRRIRKF